MKNISEQPNFTDAADDKEIVGSQTFETVDKDEQINENLLTAESNSQNKEDNVDQIGAIPSKDGFLSIDENLENEKKEIDCENKNVAYQKNGSVQNLGKFKNVENLLSAYNALEAEFTRKSQKLSDLQSVADNLNNPSADYLLEKKFDEFLITHEKAKDYQNELKGKLAEIKNINDADNILTKEYITILQANIKDEQALSDDENFLKTHIYNNKKVCDRIVARYILGIRQTKTVNVISSSGRSIALTPANFPATLSEAGEIARNIIKKK